MHEPSVEIVRSFAPESETRSTVHDAELDMTVPKLTDDPNLLKALPSKAFMIEVSWPAAGKRELRAVTIHGDILPEYHTTCERKSREEE